MTKPEELDRLLAILSDPYGTGEASGGYSVLDITNPLAAELTRLRAIEQQARALCSAALAYDEAIARMGETIEAGQPPLAQSDTLDQLYDTWQTAARQLERMLSTEAPA